MISHGLHQHFEFAQLPWNYRCFTFILQSLPMCAINMQMLFAFLQHSLISNLRFYTTKMNVSVCVCLVLRVYESESEESWF